MKTVLCTLYNSLYLDKGLVLYDSLCENAKDFKLYVLCMDEKCYDVLSDLKYEHQIPIRLSDFERGDKELLDAKATRSFGEYCWTCSSSLILYVIEKYKEPICTYIDSDLYFYQDPQILIDEMISVKKSVMITPHRFTKVNKELETNGIYCVEFNVFFNNPEALEVLRKWRNDCLDCCTSENDGVHFGDQKYLDEWPQKYSCVYVCPHLGAGVAPWNIQSYKLQSVDGNNIRLYEIKQNNIIDLIFYHFHYITYIDENTVNIHVFLNKLNVQRKLVKTIYSNYLIKINQRKAELKVKYGIVSTIKIHPVLKVKESQSIFNRLRRASFTNIVKQLIVIYNRVIIIYNRRNDYFKIFQ